MSARHKDIQGYTKYTKLVPTQEAVAGGAGSVGVVPPMYFVEQFAHVVEAVLFDPPGSTPRMTGKPRHRAGVERGPRGVVGHTVRKPVGSFVVGCAPSPGEPAADAGASGIRKLVDRSLGLGFWLPLRAVVLGWASERARVTRGRQSMARASWCSASMRSSGDAVESATARTTWDRRSRALRRRMVVMG